MNTALNIRNVGPEIKAALSKRAKEEGRPMADVARGLLAEALGVEPETPETRWKRENAEGLEALNRRSLATLGRLEALSAVPFPSFGEEP